MNIDRSLNQLILLVALCYIAYLHTCNAGKPSPAAGQEQLVRLDTNYIIHQLESRWKRPEPDTIIITKYRKEKDVAIYRDQNPEFIFMDIDTAAILQDYFAKIVYKDSLITPFGKIGIEDTVSENRIINRQWNSNLKFPEITKTVSLPQKTKLFTGISGLYSKSAIGGEINLTLMDRKERQFEIAGGFFGNQPYARFGTKIKLQLR